VNVSLRQLRAFVAVAETGSFTAAGRRMHLTPSALSLLVKELEAATGVRLFERSTRHTTLTPAGDEFLPMARKVLDDLEQALASVQELQQKKRGIVRIACTPLYAAVLLPQLIARYRERYPAIEVLMLDSLNQTALQRVASGEADFGIAPQRPTPPELQQQALYKDRVCLFCTPEHPLAAGRTATWAQVLREPFVSLTQDFTARLQADLSRHSPALQLQPAHAVSLVTTALGMVRAGYGVTAQPASALPLAETFGLVTRKLSAPVVWRQLSLFTRRANALSPAAQSFREFVVEALKPLSS
jgi:DNA-binding transcriptional LysR family regulator